MKELYDFICHYCAFGRYGMPLLEAMNKVDQRMLNKAKDDLELFERLKKEKNDNED